MTLPPDQWEEARLVAYIEYEAERPRGTRPERIGVCNKRLQRLRE